MAQVGFEQSSWTFVDSEGALVCAFLPRAVEIQQRKTRLEAENDRLLDELTTSSFNPKSTTDLI